MKTTEITVTSLGQGMTEALAETEKLGAACGLAPKEILRLRLLAEELIGMMRGIVGKVEARYVVEETNKKFDLRLSADVRMTRELKEELISVSSKRKNAASTGLMGKLKDMIATALLPDDSGLGLFSDYSVDLMSATTACCSASQELTSEALYWSLTRYRNSVDGKRSSDDKAKEAWDELEKSIVANVADEVVVRIVGSSVEIAIQKAF